MENYLSITLLAIALLVLIVFSGIFSSSETAFTTITKFKYDTYYKKRKKGFIYKINLKLITHYQMTLSTILVSNTLVNVAASTLSTLFFEQVLQASGVDNAISIATGVATGVITFLLLMFGEFLPKSLARKYSIKLLRVFGIVIYFFYIIFWPLNWVLCKIVKDDIAASATEQELDTLIDIVTKEGVIESHEASLVSNALKFDETQVRSVMTKYEYVATVDVKQRINTIAQKFKTSTYTRLPVKKNGKYIGILNLKTFFKHYNGDKKVDIESILDPIFYVSQYDNLEKTFKEMQLYQSHMALVKKNTDSSKIVGIVTMENLIEELVGKIYDENDRTDNVTIINDFTWRVQPESSASQFIDECLKLKYNVDENMTIDQWLIELFSIKKAVDGKVYEDKNIKVTIRKMRNKNMYFIVEKKVKSY